MLPVAFLLGDALSPARSRTKYLAAVLALVFALFNLTSPKILGLAVAEWCDQHSFGFFGALILYFCTIGLALRKPDVLIRAQQKAL